MSIEITLPEGILKLKRASIQQDHSSHVLQHNLNMEEIEKWLNAIKVAVDIIASEEDNNTTNANDQIERYAIAIPVNLTANSEVTDANGFKISRSSVDSSNPRSTIVTITDENTNRNVNFSSIIGVGVKTFSGQIVYPTIIQNLTNLQIVFDDFTEIENTPTHTGAVSTDPNTKIITFI